MYMWIDKTEIEQRSLQVRQEHSIQTYGVKDIFSLIAQRGIHLIRYPFGKDKLLGFSTFLRGRKLLYLTPRKSCPGRYLPLRMNWGM